MPRSYLVSVLSSSSFYCTCLSRGSFSAASARRVKTAEREATVALAVALACRWQLANELLGNSEQ